MIVTVRATLEHGPIPPVCGPPSLGVTAEIFGHRARLLQGPALTVCTKVVVTYAVVERTAGQLETVVVDCVSVYVVASDV